MLTKSQARARAKQEILTRCAEVDPKIVDENTLDYEWGWAFFYNSREYLETGNISSALAGNGALLVNKYTGDIATTGTGRPLAEYVQEYEEQLRDSTHGDA